MNEFPDEWEQDAEFTGHHSVCPLKPKPKWLYYKMHFGWRCRLCWKCFDEMHQVTLGHRNKVAYYQDGYQYQRQPPAVPPGCYKEQKYGLSYWGQPVAVVPSVANPGVPPPPLPSSGLSVPRWSSASAPPGLDNTPMQFQLPPLTITRDQLEAFRYFLQMILAALPPAAAADAEMPEAQVVPRDDAGGPPPPPPPTQ